LRKRASTKEEKEMARTHPWEISDEFWSLVEPLLPESRRDPGRIYLRRPGGGGRPVAIVQPRPGRIYKRKPGGGRKAEYSDRLYFAGIVYGLRTGIIWNAFPRE
jgi:transposase